MKQKGLWCYRGKSGSLSHATALLWEKLFSVAVILPWLTIELSKAYTKENAMAT